jgi:hypothetical protein
MGAEAIVTGDWRKLHHEQLHALCSSANIICVFKSRNEMGRACGTSEVWWSKLKDRDHLEDLGSGGRIILKEALKK